MLKPNKSWFSIWRCFEALFLNAAFISSYLADARELHVPGDFSTLQAAVLAAGDEDTLLVARGSYPEKIDLNRKSLSIKSTGGPQVTFLDSVRFFDSGLSVLEGFSLMAVESRDSSPTITRNIVTGRDGILGGGIRCIDGSPSIIENVIFENFSGDAELAQRYRCSHEVGEPGDATAGQIATDQR